MEIILYNNKLKVFEDGTVLTYGKQGKNRDKYYEMKPRWSKGYNTLMLCYEGKTKVFSRHRIVAFVYKGLDINDVTKMVDHIDRDRSNNNITNLRCVTAQQNLFNRKTKGYSLHKPSGKYRVKIMSDGIIRDGGYFENEEDAKKKVEELKQLYHIF